MFNHSLTKLLPPMTSILLNNINSFWLLKLYKNMFLYEITHRYLKNDYQFFDTLKTKHRKIWGNCHLLIKVKFHKWEWSSPLRLEASDFCCLWVLNYRRPLSMATFDFRVQVGSWNTLEKFVFYHAKVMLQLLYYIKALPTPFLIHVFCFSLLLWKSEYYFVTKTGFSLKFQTNIWK